MKITGRLISAQSGKNVLLDIIVQEIILNTRAQNEIIALQNQVPIQYAHVDITVQHYQANQHLVDEQQNIVQNDQNHQVIVKRQKNDTMLIHHVNNIHVPIKNEVHIIQVMQVLITVIIHVVQIIHHI